MLKKAVHNQNINEALVVNNQNLYFFVVDPVPVVNFQFPHRDYPDVLGSPKAGKLTQQLQIFIREVGDPLYKKTKESKDK